VEHQKQIIASLTESQVSFKTENDNLISMNKILHKDNRALETQMVSSESKLQYQIKLYDDERSKTFALEMKISQLTNQLLEKSLQSKKDFDDKLSDELSRLRYLETVVVFSGFYGFQGRS
jgi:predicted RNase H-like nuclease (RuvC/YqgF family)